MAKKGAPKPKAEKVIADSGLLPDTHTNAPGGITDPVLPPSAAAAAEIPAATPAAPSTDVVVDAMDVGAGPVLADESPDDVALDNMCRDVIVRLERAVKTGHGLTIDKELMSEAAALFRFVIGVGEKEDLQPPSRVYGRVVPAPPIGHSL
jgi:hypothetical protein